MVQGVVNANLEAIVFLTIIGSSGQALEVEAVVDTGFTEFLMLPNDLVEHLGVDLVFTNRMGLADGSIVELDVHNVTVKWDGRDRNVQAIASTGMSLVGMRMLEDHSLRVEVKGGGKVLIESLG